MTQAPGVRSTPTPQSSLPKKLDDFPKDRFNVLYPSQSIIEISPLQKLSFEVVTIDPDPNNKEVFKVGSHKEGENWVDDYALAKPALEKIAHAAGIIFDPNTTRRVDDQRNPRRVEFQATGALKKPDGTWITDTKTKEIDLDALEAETRQNLEKQAQDGNLHVGSGKDKRKLAFGTPECKAEIERRVRDKMIQVQKFKVALADTGAHNRVIRALLALKPSFSKRDFEKPFVVPHLTLNTEFALADPEMRRELIRQASGSTASVFGGGLPEARPVAQLQAPSPQTMEAIVIEPEEEKEAVPPLNPSDTVNGGTGEIRMSEKDYKAQSAACKREERITEIERLVKVKGYTPNTGSKGPAELADQTQVDYLWFLYSLPDPKPVVEAPLPWGKP